MSPPRLTGALRSFSNVSKKVDFTQELSDLKVRPTNGQTLCKKHILNSAVLCSAIDTIQYSLNSQCVYMNS